MQKYIDRGYKVEECSVRFIVAWKEENDKEDTAVILQDITLRKEK